MSSATALAIEPFVSPAVRDRVRSYLEDWRGEEPPLGSAWLDEVCVGLGTEERAIAKLLLMVAIAAYRVDDRMVNDARAPLGGSDIALFTAVSWAAFQAALRVGSWLGAPETPSAMAFAACSISEKG